MNKRKGIKKLSRKKSHREALLRNQMRSIFEHGYIVTTTPKGKALKQRLSIFLNDIKAGDLEANRHMHSVLGKPQLVDVARKYVQKTDGKISMVKVSFRDGDAGETSRVSLLGYEDVFGKKKKKKVEEKRAEKKKGDKGSGGETDEKKEVMEEKDNVDKGFMDKLNTNLKGKFVSKERARSRSGL